MMSQTGDSITKVITYNTNKHKTTHKQLDRYKQTIQHEHKFCTYKYKAEGPKCCILNRQLYY